MMSDKEKIDEILSTVKSFEERILRIERLLSISDEENTAKKKSGKAEKNYNSEAIELHFGRIWLAKIGLVVLLIGVLFLISLSFEGMPQILPPLIGYVISGFTLAVLKFGKGRSWLQDLELYLLGGFFVLLYFSTLRLSYFGEDVVIANRLIETLLLASVGIISIIIAFKKGSVYLIVIAALLGFSSALLSTHVYFSLILIAVFTISLVAISNRSKLKELLIPGIIITYISHVIWYLIFLNKFNENPIYLFVELGDVSVIFYFLIFSIGIAYYLPMNENDLYSAAATFLNSVFATILIAAISYSGLPDYVHLFCLLGFLVFLSVAFVYYKKCKSNYSTYFASIAGHLLLSIAIISYFDKPDYFIWLGWQSLLVVSTAILFRSRFIVVSNSIIYIMTLAAYLILAGKVSSISISFGVVALLSARILNWQKERLSINSEIIRNLYLICAFFIFPYSFYNWLPNKYVVFSWAAISIVYFIFSLLLKNTKYRLMALLTLLMTVIYLLLFGITGLSAEIRIVSFIILGIILLLVSIFYSKMKSKVPDNKDK